MGIAQHAEDHREFPAMQEVKAPAVRTLSRRMSAKGKQMAPGGFHGKKPPETVTL